MIRNKLRLAIILGLMLISFPAYCIGDEKQKTIEEEYAVNEGARLTISNKFGDINVKDWEDDRISVKVTITVDARSESRADELLDYIEINRTQSGNSIIFETEINNRIESTGFGWFGNSGNHELDIDYEIFAPAYINAQLSNKYGDVFVNRVDGHAAIEVNYGNLLINNLSRGDEKPLNQISLGYSDGDIENLNWAKIEMKYSKMEIEEAKALIMVSKYSKFYLDKASSLVAESKYDTYNIDELSNFVATAAYSNYKIDAVKKKFHIESRYTNAKVDYVPSHFEEIFIESKYGGFRFGIDPDASYTIEGEADYAKIYYPDMHADVNRIVDNNEMSVSGTIGKNASSNANVRIETKYGNVHLND